MKKAEILKGIEKEGTYGFLCNHYWELTKEELKDIAKEIDFTLDNNDTRKSDIIENLKDWWYDELEYENEEMEE